MPTNNAVNDTAKTDQNGQITIDVLKNDLPSGSPKTLTSLSGSKSAKGAAISIVNGKVVYNPNGDPTIAALAQGETGVDTFTYTMTEPGRKVYTASVTVNLTGVNDKPVIAGTVANQATKDTSTINPFTKATVSDVDNGASDSLTITTTDDKGNLTDANGLLSGKGLTQTGVGTYKLDATNPTLLSSELQNLTFSPTAHQSTDPTITTTFNLIATDQYGAAATNSTTTVVATQSVGPPSSQIVGYGTTLIKIPNTVNNTIVDGTAFDTNDSGEVVGDYVLQTGPGLFATYGFTLTNNGLNTVLFPGTTNTQIEAVNNDGDYAGVYGRGASFTNQAFVFDNGIYTTITGTGGFHDLVVGMNDKGQVAVTDAQATLSWIYDDNTGVLTPVTGINPSTDHISLSDINEEGVAVGTARVSGSSPDYAFIYDTNTGEKHGFDFGTNTTLTGINDKGDVIGTHFDTTLGKTVAFIALDVYSDGQFHFDSSNVTTLGVQLNPSGINNNDVVVLDDQNQHTLVYGGSLTKNQNIDITPNNFHMGSTAINNSNVISGFITDSTGTASYPIFATPITT
jgi:VCBS repeat-containing protein